MPDPGPNAEERRVAARQSRLEQPWTNILAVAVATREAIASRLPGRVNGPADAYRHIVWVGEMARRYGPNNAGRFAEAHEIQGRVEAIWREATGRADSIGNPAATAMDRRNNLIGVSIGERARSFDDVLHLAREFIDQSPKDGSGGVAGAVWLPEIRWSANPSGDRSTWNWPNPDWTRVPRDHVAAYGWAGEQHRWINQRRNAAERRAALDAERRAEWQRLLEQDDAAGDGPQSRASGGEVNVRAHQRDGHPVRAHTRNPPGPDAP